MQKELHLIKNEDKDDNIINFEEIRKGLSTGGPTSDENWLRKLNVGTVFLAKQKKAPKDTLVCDLYCVLEHKTVSSNLMIKIPDGKQMDLWFRTLEFSRQNDLVEIIAEVEFGYEKEVPDKEEPIEKENKDGDSIRPV